ncbi:unnamed protein product, partial [Didymodactylos carnosus]
DDQPFRLALFYSDDSLAGIVGGILAFAVDQLHTEGNLAGWQWIFLIEGLNKVESDMLVNHLREDAGVLADEVDFS